MLTGLQIRMARHLLEWTSSRLAGKCKFKLDVIKRSERDVGEPCVTAAQDGVIRGALEAAGVEFTTKAISRLLQRSSVYTVAPFDYAALSDDAREARARQAASKINDLQRDAIIDIGRELSAKKEALPHGEFDQWI